MASQVVQIPVLKQGVWEKGNWSTRILTIDVDTATVTISRHNHPKNVLYHALQLDLVQMWPHFTQRDLEDYIQSINAKMTLRLIGKPVPVPDFSLRQVGADTSMKTGGKQPASRVSSVPGAAVASASSWMADYAYTTGDGTKKQRAVHIASTRAEVWMLRFTTYQVYELALMMINAMRDERGLPKQLLGKQAERDLQVIRGAWVKAGGATGLNAETAGA